MNQRNFRDGGTHMRTRKVLTMLMFTSLLFFGVARAAEQKTFATPEEAVQALVKAAADGSQEEMLAVYGDDGKELVYSGDAVQDKARLQRFVKAYNTKHTIVAKDENTRILQVGPNNWPTPIPIVNDGGKWRFDTAAGKEELLFRRIGHNELGAIATCRGFIEAQRDYAASGHDGLPAGIFASRLMSEPGKQNGLYWETKEDEAASPAGPLLAQAGGQGYASTAGRAGEPYHGYLYRILTAQGAAAKGGAKSYLSDGKLTGGVALVAYPAQYKVSGVMTFIINQRGVVYQEDLGENTEDLASSMTEYNPDSTWTKVTD
jgi:Protein of unknown function (DUF2950)